MRKTGYISLLICVLLVANVRAEKAEKREKLRVSPRIVSIHTVDTHSIKSILKSICRPEMTREEKALAIWKFCWKHTWHRPPAKERKRSSYQLDGVYDALKLLNVYGYSYCYGIRALAEALYDAAGFEARSTGISGHQTVEVFFNGKYHNLDNDQRGYSRLEDGTIASVADFYAGLQKLLITPIKPSSPFFPAVRNPRMTYEQRYIAASQLFSPFDDYSKHNQYRTVHSMSMVLRPGERFVRFWKGCGKWNCVPGVAAEAAFNGYIDPWKGPYDPYFGLYPEAPAGEDGKALTYANGLLLYRPSLDPGSRDYADGVFRDHNINSSGNGFCPVRAGEVSWAEFRVSLPYVIAGYPGHIKNPGDTRGAAVVWGRYTRTAQDSTLRILVSGDNGRTWHPVWKAKKTGTHKFAVDFTSYAEAQYAYRIRFEMSAARVPDSVRIDSFGIETACQLNPAVLPAVRKGENRMHISFSPDREVFERTYYFNEDSGYEKSAYGIKGLMRIPHKHYSQLTPDKPGGEGWIIYEISAPAGMKVGWADIGGTFRGLRTAPEGQYYRMEYSVDMPGKWIKLWEADKPPYHEHWCFEANAAIRPAAPAERLYVRYALGRSTDEKAEGGRIVATRMSWGCCSADNAPAGMGIRVTHTWKQDGTAKKHTETVSKNGSYAFTAQGGDVENISISIEPAVRPQRSAAPHPLMLTPPEVKKERFDNTEKVRALKEALARLERSPSVETAEELMYLSSSRLVRIKMPGFIAVRGGEKALRALKKAHLNGLKNAGLFYAALLGIEGPTGELAGFLDHTDTRLRSWAASFLQHRNDKAAVKPLRKQIRKEYDQRSRALQIRALLKISDHPDDIALAEDILEIVSGENRIITAGALASRGSGKGMHVLKIYLLNTNPYLRACASAELAACGTAPEDLLIENLTDPSQWVRRNAVVGLSRFGTEICIEHLHTTARSDVMQHIRKEAEWAVRKVKERVGRDF